MSHSHRPFLSSLPRSGSASAQSLDSAPPQSFSWTRQAESGGTIRLVLVGELDLAARAHFESALADAQYDSQRVVLDLEALTLIDCACLQVLFTAARRCRPDGAVLVLRHPSGQVRRVLNLVGAPASVAICDANDFPEPTRLAAA